MNKIIKRDKIITIIIIKKEDIKNLGWLMPQILISLLHKMNNKKNFYFIIIQMVLDQMREL